MEKLKGLIKQYKSLIAYVFFGVCTTAINIIVYYLCYDVWKIANVPSTVLAWIVSVIFAYITNKLFVFDSKSLKPSVVVKECISFFGCRLLTGVLDVAIMYAAVDVLKQSSILWKLISNIIVVILNYIAGKIIFKSNKN